MAGMFKGTETAATGEGAELWHATHAISKAPRTHNKELRQELGWMTLERRREVARMKLMHKCVKIEAPRCIYDRIQPVKQKNRGECRLFYQERTQTFTRNPSHLEEYKPGTLYHHTSELSYPPVYTFIKHILTVM